MSPIQRIVLIGLSGVGKSSVSRLVAARLGWTALDTDAETEAAFAESIPAIFSRHGEAAFRATERATLLRGLSRERVVIACGGGTVVDPALWTPDLLNREETLVVALDADPATSLHRLVQQLQAEGESTERPLLAGDDPLARLAEIKARRRASYDAADVTIATDRVPLDVVANEVAWLVQLGPNQTTPCRLPRFASGDSEVVISPGSAGGLGALIRRRWPSSHRVWIVSDDTVGPLHGPAINRSVTELGFTVNAYHVPTGESSKSLRMAGEVYDWLLDAGIERGDVIVALGGGVVGDLAGFIAATVLRGVGLVQVPTSLLAMVDSSIGGKTGIDHRAGKNLIGAFYQPSLVVVDPAFLRTLPDRQVVNGWAEIIKHAIIQPSTPGGVRADLLTAIERNHGAFGRGSQPAISYLIWRNIALKAAVVAADEREAGIRAFLNFGHTLGHAIEAAGYRLLHGEAVAVGMRAESAIGVEMGLCSPERAALIAAALDRGRLPPATDANPDTVLALIGSDKKRTAGKLRWVLPVSTGGVTIRDDVPSATVAAALDSVTERSGQL